MALSGILIGAGDVRPSWQEVGVHLIAVDTLVHNFLHRARLARKGFPAQIARTEYDGWPRGRFVYQKPTQFFWSVGIVS